MSKMNFPKELVEAIKKQFEGRTDAYAEQKKKGGYTVHRKPLTDSIVIQHLDGEKTIAFYLLKEGFRTKCIVFDIDNDSIETVKIIKSACKLLNISCYAEKTGGRGYHIWIFLNTAINASDAIALAKLIIKNSGASGEIEIFPKQKKTKNLGNPIRLPFGIHQGTGGRSYFLDDALNPIEDTLTALKEIHEVEEATVKSILEANAVTIIEEAQPTPESSAGSPDYNLNAKNMHMIIERCPCLKELVERADKGEHIPYDQWRKLAGIFVNFGPEGGKYFHEISAKDKASYNQKDCQKLLDDYKANGHKPTSCESMNCGRDPEEDCGLEPHGNHKQSPVRFGFSKDKRLSTDKPLSIHLIEIEDAKHDYKPVSTSVMIAAVGDTYHIPKSYRITCTTSVQDKKYCAFCPYRDGKIIEIAMTDPILIEFCNSTSSQVDAILSKRADLETNSKCWFAIDIQDRIHVQELVVVPKAFMIKTNKEGKVVDETGHDYRYKLVYYTGALASIDGYFQASGVVVPHPKNQRATLLASEMKRLSTELSAFNMTDELKTRFHNFQVIQEGIDGVREAIDRILKDVTYNITEIYGEHRETVLLFVLLTAHSILSFKFDGSLINKGWVEIIVIGDTGQGKSRLVEKLFESAGIGQLITGSAASRTGIAYSLDTVIDGKRLLRWGALPLNDGKLLVIDEWQKILAAQIEELSSARSSGLLKVDRSVKGEHKSRVRLILLANPVTNESLSAQVFGVVVLKFQRPADIRRLDAAILVSKDDQDAKDIIYRRKNEREKVEQLISGELLKQSLLWAWTRKVHDVVFESAASDEIMKQAKVLIGEYEVSDIPLVSTDVHEKLARLSVALATLLHSTDESHEKVIVKPEHVQYVVGRLHDVYSHKNCELDKYAASLNERETLTDMDYHEIIDDINEKIESETYKGATVNVLRTLLTNDFVRQGELGDKFAYGPKAIRERLEIFTKRNMLSLTSKGYKKTKKAVVFLKRYFDETRTAESGS